MTSQLETSNEEKEYIYNISVIEERWDEDDLEAGDTDKRVVVVDKEDHDTDQLERVLQDYGINEPSSSVADIFMWFNSTEPTQDREYFEKGIRKYHSLHIHSVNGENPTAEDFLRIARLGNIRLSESAYAPRPSTGQ